MDRKVTVKTGGAAVAVLAAMLAHPAEALRCGPKVIARGDPAAKVLEYCGEPIDSRSRLIERSLVGRYGPAFAAGWSEEVAVEEWTYNFGPHKLMRLIELEDGIVTQIRTLGYGYTPRRSRAR